MKKKGKVITRRDFLCGAASVALMGAAASTHLRRAFPEGGSLGERARVILVRDADVIDVDGRLNSRILQRMLDDGVKALVGESDPVSAWRRVVRPADTVGIKSNVWGFLPTPPELEAAIKRRLQDAGVSKSRIGIDDRGVRRNRIFREATALINVRPLRTHHWSGVGGLIKNYITFSKNPASWHPDSCADLAGVWDLPIVKDKTRLNILVMLTPLFHGKGPHHFQRKYTWPYKGLLIGTDPVAVDATGLRILEEKRRVYFGKALPLAVPPRHIRLAQDKYQLGTADPARIEIVRVGWMEGVLI